MGRLEPRPRAKTASKKLCCDVSPTCRRLCDVDGDDGDGCRRCRVITGDWKLSVVKETSTTRTIQNSRIMKLKTGVAYIYIYSYRASSVDERYMESLERGKERKTEGGRPRPLLIYRASSVLFHHHPTHLRYPTAYP